MRVDFPVRPMPAPQARQTATPQERNRILERRAVSLLNTGVAQRLYQAVLDLHDTAGEPLEIEYEGYIIRLEVLPK
jgi:hypothetical protein